MSKKVAKPITALPVDSIRQLDEPIRHYPIVINCDTNIQRYSQSVLESTSGTMEELDGFLMLEIGQVEFPEDLQQVNLIDRRLNHVVEQDLSYFSELLCIDASENYLPLSTFGILPKLRELRLVYNQITTIEELYGFTSLLYLDLSYNKLSIESIQALSVLPQLKDLDLSGNDLPTLPSSLSSFQSLEKLVLDHNKLRNNMIFITLSAIPNLRVLSVSHNFFSKIPLECCEFGGFRFLDTLDITYNYFNTSDSVMGIIKLPRLLTLTLYGNPVLGPTGEDPLFIYIEEVMNASISEREVTNSRIPDVEFVTEIPKKKVMRKGKPLGRHSLYRDFSIVEVENDKSKKDMVPDRSSRNKNNHPFFLQKANQLLSRGGDSIGALFPDNTFLTNLGIGAGGGGGGGGDSLMGGGSGVAVLNEEDTNAIADDVMQKVVKEMNLVGTEDFQLLEEYIRLPTIKSLQNAKKSTSPLLRSISESGGGPGMFAMDISNRNKQAMMDEEFDANSSIASDDRHHELYQRKANGAVPGGNGHNNNVSDGLPDILFGQQDLVRSTTIATQNIALKAAMQQLKRALDQPLTDYHEVPSRKLKESSKNFFARPTKVSQMRQDEKLSIAYHRLLGTQPPSSMNGQPQAPPTIDTNVSHSQKYPSSTKNASATAAGAPSSSPTHHRKKVYTPSHSHRNHTQDERQEAAMSQINEVLMKLNEKTNELTHFPNYVDVMQQQLAQRQQQQLQLQQQQSQKIDSFGLSMKMNAMTMMNGGGIGGGESLGGSGSSGQGNGSSSSNATGNTKESSVINARMSMNKMQQFASKPHPGIKNLVSMVRDVMEEFNS